MQVKKLYADFDTDKLIRVAPRQKSVRKTPQCSRRLAFARDTLVRDHVDQLSSSLLKFFPLYIFENIIKHHFSF